MFFVLKVRIEICHIDIYFQSASEFFFLGFEKDRNTKLYNFSALTLDTAIEAFPLLVIYVLNQDGLDLILKMY